MTWTVKFHLKTMLTKKIGAASVEEEDWVEYIKRSTEEAMEKMESAKIRCWNKTQKMKWKLALRIATSPIDRWLRKAAEWNPELSTRYWITRAIGRPRKRWEDDINEFLKHEFEDTKYPIESNNQTNKTWISIAKDRGNWALLEETYTMTVEERQEMEKMESAKIRCWNKTQKMKWKLALRIATSPIDRWLRKAAEWNPELSTKDRGNWALLEETYTMTVEERQEMRGKNDHADQRDNLMGEAK